MNKSIKSRISNRSSSKLYNACILIANIIIYSMLALVLCQHFGNKKDESEVHDITYYFPLFALILAVIPIAFLSLLKKHFLLRQFLETMPDITCILLSGFVLKDADFTGWKFTVAVMMLFICTAALFIKIHLVSKREEVIHKREELQKESQKKQREIDELQNKKNKIQEKIDTLIKERHDIQSETAKCH